MSELGNGNAANLMDVEMRWGVRIPLRNGLQLSATIYLPRGQATAAPSVVVLTPYVAQRHHDRGIYFAEHGYPFLTVDVRGRGNSDGQFHPLNEGEGDGHDVIEWVARQPFCNGKVAMWGGSYSGCAQWATAKSGPRGLATIVPVAAPFRGVDSPVRNNVFTPYTMQWLTLLSGRAAQDKIFADQSFWRTTFRRWIETGAPFAGLDQFVGNPSAIFREWIAHPEVDAYWDRYNPTPQQYAQLDVPVLTITGIYDGNQPGALTHYREHLRYNPRARSKHHLIIGPWDHAGAGNPVTEFAGLKVGPASVVDLPALHCEWYAWTMADGPRPGFLLDNVAYYVMVADKWRYVSTLDEATERYQRLYLQSSGNTTDVGGSGLLRDEPPAQCEPDYYDYDPRDVSLAKLESSVDPGNRADQRMVHAAAGKHLVYHTAPFQHDTEVTGCFRLVVWLAIDQPDTDFRVSIFDVADDESSVELSTDWMRARYRQGLREPRLVDTTVPLVYEFTRFTFVSRQVRAGHRLRLILGPINSIHFQKNYNSGRVVAEESMLDARPVRVRLFHDEAHPSALYVPLGRAEI